MTSFVYYILEREKENLFNAKDDLSIYKFVGQKYLSVTYFTGQNYSLVKNFVTKRFFLSLLADEFSVNKVVSSNYVSLKLRSDLPHKIVFNRIKSVLKRVDRPVHQKKKLVLKGLKMSWGNEIIEVTKLKTLRVDGFLFNHPGYSI